MCCCIFFIGTTQKQLKPHHTTKIIIIIIGEKKKSAAVVDYLPLRCTAGGSKGSPFLEHSHYKNLFQFTDTYKDIFDPMGWTIALELAFYVALAIPCGYYFYVVTGPLQNEKFELTNNISKIQQKC